MPAAKRITKTEFRAALNWAAEALIAELRSRVPDDCGDRVMLEYRDTAIEYQLALNAAAVATDRHKLAAHRHAAEIGMRFAHCKVAARRWNDARQMGYLAAWPDSHWNMKIGDFCMTAGGSA